MTDPTLVQVERHLELATVAYRAADQHYDLALQKEAVGEARLQADLATIRMRMANYHLRSADVLFKLWSRHEG